MSAPTPAKPWNDRNPLLARVAPARLLAGVERGPDGAERLVATIQGVQGEMTISLDWDTAELWINTLAEGHAMQSRLTTTTEMPGQAQLPFGGNGQARPR